MAEDACSGDGVVGNKCNAAMQNDPLRGEANDSFAEASEMLQSALTEIDQIIPVLGGTYRPQSAPSHDAMKKIYAQPFKLSSGPKSLFSHNRTSSSNGATYQSIDQEVESLNSVVSDTLQAFRAPRPLIFDRLHRSPFDSMPSTLRKSSLGSNTLPSSLRKSSSGSSARGFSLPKQDHLNNNHSLGLASSHYSVSDITLVQNGSSVPFELTQQLASALRSYRYDKDFPPPPKDCQIRNIILRWLVNVPQSTACDSSAVSADINGNGQHSCTADAASRTLRPNGIGGEKVSAMSQQEQQQHPFDLGNPKKAGLPPESSGFWPPTAIPSEFLRSSAFDQQRCLRRRSNEGVLSDQSGFSSNLFQSGSSNNNNSNFTLLVANQAASSSIFPNVGSAGRTPAQSVVLPGPSAGPTLLSSAGSSFESHNNSLTSLRHVTPPSCPSSRSVVPYSSPKNSYTDYQRAKLAIAMASSHAGILGKPMRDYSLATSDCSGHSDSAYGSNISTGSVGGGFAAGAAGPGSSGQPQQRLSHSLTLFLGPSGPAGGNPVLPTAVTGASATSQALSGSSANASSSLPPPYARAVPHSLTAGASAGMMLHRGHHRQMHRIHRSLSDSKYTDAYHQHASPRNSWFGVSRSPSPSTSTVSCPEYGDFSDKLHRLEADRESLSLQVTILSEQVGAQTEKIRDLESLLDDKKLKLDNTEELLQEELMTRTTLETSKLDMMSEISAMKLRFTSLEKDKIETEQRLLLAQSEISQLQRHICERNNEVAHVRSRAGGSLDQTSEIDQLKSAVQQLMVANSDKEQRISALSQALQQHQSRLASLGITESQPGFSIQHSRSGPTILHGVGSRHAIGNGTNNSNGAASGNGIAQSSSAALAEAEDINERLRQLLSDDQLNLSNVSTSTSFADSFVYQQPYSGAGVLPTNGHRSQPGAHSLGVYGSFPAQKQPAAGVPASTSIPSYLNTSIQSSSSYMSSLSNPSVGSLPSTPRHNAVMQIAQQNQGAAGGGGTASPLAAQLAAELDSLAPAFYGSKSPPYHCGSLGRQPAKGPAVARKDRRQSGGESRAFFSERGGAGRSGFGFSSPDSKGLKSWLRKSLRAARRSTSAPNLAESDEETSSSRSSAMKKLSNADPRLGAGALKSEKKQNSLKNLFGKFRPANHGDALLGDGKSFKRGDRIRATAGPRLGWSAEPQQQSDLKSSRAVPLRPSYEVFCRWPPDLLCDWLVELGLTMYVADCKRNIRSGRHLMNCRSADLDKELGIKNPMHRKKLNLYMTRIEQGIPDASERLDYPHVLRWLDDIGLPQFRDTFAEARVDGLVLDQLLVQDLLEMKVTLAVHHASLARAIETLRLIGFNPNRLQRKFQPEQIKAGPCPQKVQLWTQHCLCEWLKSIDLTEFTPNLMCAGVHGALLVLEPMFTAESLASILQIPAQKTLLRRHLSTHFNQLLGSECIAGKRDFLAECPWHQHLTQAIKIKPLKKGFSLTKKQKSKLEIYADPEDLVCAPVSPSISSASSSHSSQPPAIISSATVQQQQQDIVLPVPQRLFSRPQSSGSVTRNSEPFSHDQASDILKLASAAQLLENSATSNV